MINAIRQYQVPLQKYIAMMDLQVAVIISVDFCFYSLIFYYWMVRFILYLYTIVLSGKKRKAILQASYWACWGITPSCIYSNRRWSLPEIWKHLYKSPGSIHKFERKVCLIASHFSSWLLVNFKLRWRLEADCYFRLGICKGKDSWSVAELAWEEYSSHCCHWRRADPRAGGSWLSCNYS